MDLRPVNIVKETYNWPMLKLESALAQSGSAKCFATLDMGHGYWQMPLHEDSQEFQSFITPHRHLHSYARVTRPDECRSLLSGEFRPKKNYTRQYQENDRKISVSVGLCKQKMLVL